MTLQSGPSFTVNTQVNTVFSAIGALRADVSKNPNLAAGERTLARWFDTSAFSQPVAVKFGNQGVDILRGDGLVNFDFSAMKGFSLPGEGRKLQFRCEMFNGFNHPNFGLPGRSFGGPGFGIRWHGRSGAQHSVGAAAGSTRDGITEQYHGESQRIPVFSGSAGGHAQAPAECPLHSRPRYGALHSALWTCRADAQPPEVR